LPQQGHVVVLLACEDGSIKGESDFLAFQLLPRRRLGGNGYAGLQRKIPPTQRLAGLDGSIAETCSVSRGIRIKIRRYSSRNATAVRAVAG
jgi:hypothetical protein